ncbi:PAS domain-containing protein [Salibaculum griseiflavum]|uniref:PAS domain-containing protein n=1 Tax=Salibaculum griseiflavum TaxID=1914409 RepID=A0A2V1P319_9RHOB|nr:PAS domain-containing protein [Salibaculum griseiflavum]PWG15712.1 PAS domain-containing protein [Salibaculum griseiflavum]
MKRASDSTDSDFTVTNPTALVDLQAYWHSLAPDGRIPRRSDLDPACLGELIEDAMIVERVAPGVARMRVAGQRIAALVGAEPRGMPLSVLFEAADRGRLATQVEIAFKMPSIVELPLEGVRGLGRPALSARLLLLPMRDEFDRVSRCLGAMVADGRVGRAPRQFKLCAEDRIRHEPLHLDPPETARAPFAKGRPALRLVVDNA